MSLRKVAGLLVAFGLMVGLLGSGVGAVFTDQVTAQEQINVGTFACKIVAPSDGTIAPDGKSVSYTAPDILSSAPGSAPFNFTVKATGSIAAKLHISHDPLPVPFTSIGDPVADVVLDAGTTQLYNVGLAWGTLGAGNIGGSLTITYTVTCSDPTTFTTFGSATVTESPLGTYTIVSNGPDPVYDPAPEYGGIALTDKNSGKPIGAVSFSFLSSGDVTGGAPRFSLPISTDGSSTVAFYAFLDAAGCGGATDPPAPATTVSTSALTCAVNAGGSYANWAAFVTAHPTYEIAPGSIPFIIADGSLGTFIVSNITE